MPGRTGAGYWDGMRWIGTCVANPMKGAQRRFATHGGEFLPADVRMQLRVDWTVLSFPAIAEEPECVPFWTPYGIRRFTRQPGEALHPDREAVAEYEAMRRRIGLYNFLSQYQQRPIPISGNLVKREWLRSYGPPDLPRRFMRIVQSWDTAAKTSELNDYSVCTTWGIEGKNFYLIDVFRRRLNYPDLKRAIVSQATMFDADKIVIEGKSSPEKPRRFARTSWWRTQSWETGLHTFRHLLSREKQGEIQFLACSAARSAPEFGAIAGVSSSST